MANNKTCIPLDLSRKFKFKVDLDGKIQYFNKYFSEFTGYSIAELILKDFSNLFDEDMPKSSFDLLLQELEENPKSYFVYKGKTKNGNCYWGLLRSTQRVSGNELKGYDLEVKLLPQTSVNTFENLYSIVNEIEKNVGTKAGLKYLEGFLEEKNISFKDFVLQANDINEKKADKYFSIDVDDNEKKKKKSWF
jgi:PAS domain S-box-containing protein